MEKQQNYKKEVCRIAQFSAVRRVVFNRCVITWFKTFNVAEIQRVIQAGFNSGLFDRSTYFGQTTCF